MEALLRSIHRIIKFWARKPIELYLREFKNARFILDPFSGSGSSGIATAISGASAILSDINPVAVFISWSILNKHTLSEETLEIFQEICNKLEKEAYELSINGQKKILTSAIWITEFRCPKCGNWVDPRRSRYRKKIKCKCCNEVFHPLTSADRRNKVVSLTFEGKILQNRCLITEYQKNEESFTLTSWYPNGKFEYEEIKRAFDENPGILAPSIEKLFTKRNLFVASKLYESIEQFWTKNREEGDLLKLTFIASLSQATNMLPYAKSSGPSWKLPRYWIPYIREERNFCRSFLRRLKTIYNFKKKIWVNTIQNYKVFACFDFNNGLEISSFKTEKEILIFRYDARKILDIDIKADVVIMDLPHYDEIHYFELLYLWQKWLEGRYKDPRFSDYSFWRYEIDINRVVGRKLSDYLSSIALLVNKSKNVVEKSGKIVFILHNRNPKIFARTIDMIRENFDQSFGVEVEKYWPKVRSSAQGIHGREKFLFLVRLKRN